MNRHNSHTQGKGDRGFTLVEMIVAVGLFAIVMVVCVSALLSLVRANRKAQALQSVMNNLNVALDGMVRAVRMGTNYHCGTGTYTTAKDCDNNDTGDTVFAFEPFGNTASVSASHPEPDPPWIYSYNAELHRIEKSEDGGLALAMTASDVTIQDMRFYVVGAARDDDRQPKVVIIIKGTAGVPGTVAETSFHIQATAVQRALDL